MLDETRFPGSSKTLLFFGGANMSFISLSREAVKSRSASGFFLLLGFLVVTGDPIFLIESTSSEPTKRTCSTNVTFAEENIIHNTI